MSHNIVPFKFQGVSLTVISDANGDPEFEANTLCQLLGYANPWDAVKKHVKPEDLVKREALTAGGKQRKNFIKERGMWRLVMKSEAPNADAVQDWIAGEVLPQIRKTGSYSNSKAATSNTPLDKLRSAQALKTGGTNETRHCQHRNPPRRRWAFFAQRSAPGIWRRGQEPAVEFPAGRANAEAY